jgi:hypothetical protein
MFPRTPNRTALAAALALAIAAGLTAGTPAHAQSTDLGSPDARDAVATSAAPPAQDLRSPDARDAGRPDPEPVPGLPTFPLNPEPIVTPAPVAANAPSAEFQWGDAAIGAAGTLGVVLLLAGATALITRRQRTATA